MSNLGRKLAYVNMHTTLFVPSMTGTPGINLPEVLTAKYDPSQKGSGYEMIFGEVSIQIKSPKGVEFGIPLTQCKLWVFEEPTKEESKKK